MEKRSYAKSQAPEVALIRRRLAITLRRDYAINERKTVTTLMGRKIFEMVRIKTRMRDIISPKVTKSRIIILIEPFRLSRRTKRKTQPLLDAKTETSKTNPAV